MERTAAVYPVTTGEVLRHLKLDREHTRSFGVALSGAQRAHLLRVLPVSDAFLDDALLTSFDKRGLAFASGALDNPQRAAATLRNEWTNPMGTGACFRCVADNGLWLTRWRVFWVSACRDHQTILVDQCPSCLRPLMGVAARASIRARPTVCHCGFDLRLAPTVAASEDLLHLQSRLDDAMSGEAVRVAGAKLSPHGFFTLLKALGYYMRVSGTDLMGARWAACAELAKLSPMSRVARTEVCALVRRTGEILRHDDPEAAVRALRDRAHSVSSRMRVYDQIYRSGATADDLGPLGRIIVGKSRKL